MATKDPVILPLLSEAAYAAGPLEDQVRVKTRCGSSVCLLPTSSITASMNASVENFMPSTRFVLVGQTICWLSLHFTATGCATRYPGGRPFLKMRLTNE